MQIDISLDGTWRPCAELTLVDPANTSRRGPVTLRYLSSYATDHLFARDRRALSVRLPVNLDILTLPRWPAFLIDLLPQGAALKRLLRDTPSSEWELLMRGAKNPVGNLRIPVASAPPPRRHPGFELDEMLARGDEFLAYAQEVGATVAGSTDTQGEAPKFWIVEDREGRWHPDAGQVDETGRRFFLLKFPLPDAGPRAADILRNEAAYQRVAHALGLRVTPDPPIYRDGALLIPRFDRRLGTSGTVRLGVESLYSVCDVLDSAHESLRHHQALIALSACVTDFATELIEYCRRDVLNLAMGNRDNHGRNTALLKDIDGTIRLAPLFDFGPTYLDARTITRVLHWDAEQGGTVDWSVALENLSTRFEDVGLEAPALASLAASLNDFGNDLERLPALMAAAGVDAAIIESRREEIARQRRSLAKITAP